MPIGRRLGVDTIVLDLAYMQAMFLKYGTMCEAPGCEPAPAYSHYQTDYSFSYLCEECWKKTRYLIGSAKKRWDTALAEHMMELLLRRSYAHVNVQSGFVLEAAMQARKETLAQIKRLDAREHNRQRTDVRNQIKASGIKPGVPDEELSTIRGRRLRRQQAGSKPIGPSAGKKSTMLMGLLIVPTAKIITTEETS